MAQPQQTHSSGWSSSIALISLQIIAFGLPLLTLPILSRGLAVEGFGALMLAQSLALLVAIFIDAGINTESQRRVSNQSDLAQRYADLWTNLTVRAGLALLATLLLLLLNAGFDWISMPLLCVSLLQVLGTLAFPQWWLIATNQGWSMGLSLVFGRLLSALAVWFWVETPDDILWASLALSSSSLLAGLCLFRQIWWPLSQNLPRHQSKQLDCQRFFKSIRPTLFSAFFAQISSNLPVLALGQAQSLRQVGLFSAAERLVRAAAHLSTYMEQIVLSRLAQPQFNVTQQQTWQRRALVVLALVLVLALGLGQLCAAPLVNWLYGAEFFASITILRVLLVWLALLIFRRAWVLWTWALHAELTKIAKLQWLETLLVSSAALLGAYSYGALGAAWLLCVSEVLLLLAVLGSQHFSRQITHQIKDSR